MRRAWLVPAALAVALVLQLTLINGLHLPRGGVPDLVLVLVVAFAMAGGPMAGMVIGFATGLCADIAPPGSPLIGQYTLVFVLAGWAAGSLGRFTERSPLRALAVAAVVIAAAETFAAALGKVLEPNQVSVAEIRHFLPITIAYDLVICPFALGLVILVATTQASRGEATSPLAGTGLLSAKARPKQAGHKPRRHVPRLDPAAGRTGDGWVGGGPGRHPASSPRAGRGTRLNPRAGRAGSASGYAHQSSLQAHPVKLSFSRGQLGAAAVGSVVGSGQDRHWQSRRHPGMLTGAGHRIRFHGEPGGSAPGQRGPAAPVRIDFRGRGGGSVAGQRVPAVPVRINFRERADGSATRLNSIRKPLRINFRERADGSATRLNSARKPLRIKTPRLRMGASRSALAMATPGTPARSTPTVHFRAATAPVARRPAAAPKFRGGSALLSPALTTARASGGVAERTSFRARGVGTGGRRLRLAGRGRGLGMLGGGGASTLRRPPARTRKVPKFGYGRRSPLTFLVRRRPPNRWLARRRAGRRSGAWMIAKRTGGIR